MGYIPTIIIEPQQLKREALASLISGAPYRITQTYDCVPGRDNALTMEGEVLVILSGQLKPTKSTAGQIRQLWPSSKIILLYERLTSAGIHDLQVAGFDGCIAVAASKETLVQMLDLVVCHGVRVSIVPEQEPAALRVSHTPQIDDSTIETLEPPHARRSESDLDDVRKVEASGRSEVPLSSRERDILQSLVKGRANKIIARRHSITEATVKVHMKSILRKIRVENRTQAAMWAIANGYNDPDPDAANALPTGESF